MLKSPPPPAAGSGQLALLEPNGAPDSGSERRAAAELLAEWAGGGANTSRVVLGGLAESLGEAAEMMARGEWDGAKARHLVALWATCHERVYGVSALGELRGLGWRSALQAAAAMLSREFGGDAAGMASFMRWCWVREGERERWRRANGKGSGRITARVQFGGSLLVEWRVDVGRKGRGNAG